MEKTTEVSPKKLSIRIELLQNGVTVSACPLKKHDCKCDGPCNHISPSYDDEMTFVYKSIEEMTKELPGFISVLKENSDLNSDNPTKHEPDMGNSKEEDEEEED